MTLLIRSDGRDAAWPDRVLSWRSVREMTGISRTTAWRLQRSGAFPQPVKLSPGRVGWREGEIAAWTAGLEHRARVVSVTPQPVHDPTETLPPPEPRPEAQPELCLEADQAPTPPQYAAPRRPRSRSPRKPRGDAQQLQFDF